MVGEVVLMCYLGSFCESGEWGGVIVFRSVVDVKVVVSSS